MSPLSNKERDMVSSCWNVRPERFDPYNDVAVRIWSGCSIAPTNLIFFIFCFLWYCYHIEWYQRYNFEADNVWSFKSVLRKCDSTNIIAPKPRNSTCRANNALISNRGSETPPPLASDLETTKIGLENHLPTVSRYHLMSCEHIRLKNYLPHVVTTDIGVRITFIIIRSRMVFSTKINQANTTLPTTVINLTTLPTTTTEWAKNNKNGYQPPTWNSNVMTFTECLIDKKMSSSIKSVSGR